MIYMPSPRVITHIPRTLREYRRETVPTSPEFLIETKTKWAGIMEVWGVIWNYNTYQTLQKLSSIFEALNNSGYFADESSNNNAHQYLFHPPFQHPAFPPKDKHYTKWCMDRFIWYPGIETLYLCQKTCCESRRSNFSILTDMNFFPKSMPPSKEMNQWTSWSSLNLLCYLDHLPCSISALLSCP